MHMSGERTPARVLDLGFHRGPEHGPEEKGVSCVEDGNVDSRRVQS